MADSGEGDRAVLWLWRRPLTHVCVDAFLVSLVLTLGEDARYFHLQLRGYLSGGGCGNGSRIWWVPDVTVGIGLTALATLLLLPIVWQGRRKGWPGWMSWGTGMLVTYAVLGCLGPRL